MILQLLYALHRHRALETAGPRDYFGPSRRPPPGAGMRVVTLAISTFGSFGAQAQALIILLLVLVILLVLISKTLHIGRRTNLFACLLRLLLRRLGLPRPSPPSLDQLLPFRSVNVLQTFSVNISQMQMTFSPLLYPNPLDCI